MPRMDPSRDLVHVAFDTSKDVLVAGILHPGSDSPAIERVFNDEASIRRFVRGFPEPRKVRSCYEAGPGGYELHRLLTSLRWSCEVIAPSLIPTAPGDRVKTDLRDARRLVRQLRAGELVAIRVPSRAEEAVRDLCRARGDATEDLTRAKNRIGHFLIRHGRIWRGGSTWTLKHRQWLGAQRFDEPAAEATFKAYKATVGCREAELDAIEADLACYVEAEPYAASIRRLSAYRGVERIGALVLQAEVCDWRRFADKEDAGAFCGLVPSEYSSGASVRRGGSPTPATSICAASSWSPPGRTASARASGRASSTARRVWRPTPWPGPGRRRSTCVDASAPSTPASRCAASSWRRSPVGSSATSTPRWWDERLTTCPIGRRPRSPVTELSVCRRGAAVAGKPPAASLRWLIYEHKRSKSGAPSCGLQTCAASAREYEIGGDWPSQSTPAAHADLGARPPPPRPGAHRGWRSSRHPVACSRATHATDLWSVAPRNPCNERRCGDLTSRSIREAS